MADYELAHPLKIKRRSIEQGEEREKNFHFTPGQVSNAAYDYAIPAVKAAMRAISPAPITSFSGTVSNGSLIPPDVNGTVGDNYILESNNQQFSIYSKVGNLRSTVSVATFFGASGGKSFFDPHVLYDPIHKRFIAITDGNISSNGDGGLFIAVSETADPTGNWYQYAIDDGDNNTNDLLDFPLVGFNKNWIVLTANMFIGNTAQSQIYVCNRDSMYRGYKAAVHEFTDNNRLFTVCPSVTLDSAQATEYMVCDLNGNNGGSGYVQVSTITGTASAPIYTVTKQVGVSSAWSETSVQAPQKGSNNTIDADDTRITGATYLNGSMWFSHTVYLPANSPTHASVDWWQIDPATPAVKQFGRIDDATGATFYTYPSINVNSKGDALVGYTVSSSSIYPSCGYSYHDSSDAVNTMRTNYTYRNGLNTYYLTFGGTRNRWGDYSATAVDPVNSSFWTLQEYANTPSNTWSVYIANVGVSPCTGRPAAGVISATNDTVCSGSNTTLNLTGYTNSGLGISFKWLQSTTLNSGWTVAGGSDTLPQLTTQAINGITYFRCVVSCKASGLSDTTAAYAVYTVQILTQSQDTVCSLGTQHITAQGYGGINWYTSANSTSSIYTGKTLTATITKDTTFYVSAGNYNTYTVGPANTGIGTVSTNTTFTNGEVFTALADFTLDSLYVYPGSAGIIKVNIINNTTNVVTSASITVTATAINKKTVVPMNMAIAGGYTYNIYASGSTVTSLYRNSAGAAFPYTLNGIVSITNNIANAGGRYYFFYDWHISSGCGTARLPHSVHVNLIPITAAISKDSICAGRADTLIAGGGFNSYTWQPGNLTGDTIIITPTTSTAYTVTGTKGSICMNTTGLSLYVDKVPLTAVASKDTLCSSRPDTLTASGALKYTWQTPNSDTTNIIVVTPVKNSIYTVTGIDALGCTSISTVHVHIDTLIVSAKAVPDSICPGAAAVLTASGATTYQWQPVNTSGKSVTVKPSANATYIVTGSNHAGCQAIDSVHVYLKQCSNGISTIVLTPSIHIYPNPTTGQLDITLNDIPGGNYSIMLINTLGEKVIETNQLLPSSTRYTWPMDVSKLSNSIYYVRISNGNNQWIQTLVKQ